MIYNYDDLVFEKSNNKILVFERLKDTKILCTIPSGSQISYECDFDFEKYKNEWTRLKTTKNKKWSDNVIQDVATVLGSESYLWGLKLKKYTVFFDSKMKHHRIKFIVEV